MPKYTCERCLKEFSQKSHFDKHQNKKIIVIKPSLDDRYSNEKIITHNDLSHECHAMNDWPTTLKKFNFEPLLRRITLTI